MAFFAPLDRRGCARTRAFKSCARSRGSLYKSVIGPAFEPRTEIGNCAFLPSPPRRLLFDTDCCDAAGTSIPVSSCRPWQAPSRPVANALAERVLSRAPGDPLFHRVRVQANRQVPVQSRIGSPAGVNLPPLFFVYFLGGVALWKFNAPPGARERAQGPHGLERPSLCEGPLFSQSENTSF